jgi:hypothetical protein
MRMGGVEGGRGAMREKVIEERIVNKSCWK